MTVESVLAQQAALYGEPLSARFARLLAAYRIPQSRLAAAIGMSAPMLSQLANGQRVKIGNPSVYARLLTLEQMASSPDVRSGDPARITAAIDEVSASSPQLTTERAATGDPARGGVDTGTVVTHLAVLASAGDLAAAAAAVPQSALAELLDAAASEALRP